MYIWPEKKAEKGGRFHVLKRYVKRSCLASGYRRHLGSSSASAAQGRYGGVIRRLKWHEIIT
jgi:hypothetical protein